MISREIQTLIPQYSFLEVIHTGISSEIYRVYAPSENEYALKIFNKKVDLERFKSELNNCKLLCKAENPDFIRYISSSEDDGISTVKYIVFELAEKRSLDNFISQGIPLGERIAKFISWKIVEMAGRLHKLCFSHRDLNIHNILVNQNYDLKLGSFGSAKYFLNQNGKSVLLFGRVGTPYYMPPEMNKKLYDGKKADIFSLGVLILNLISGKQIFKIHKEIVFKLIKKKEYNKFWYLVENGNINLKLTPEFKDLIISMIDYNPNNRPDISDVLNHPYFEDIRSFTSDEYLENEKNMKSKLKEIEEKLSLK